MRWEDLTMGQMGEMLLKEEYRGHWQSWERLRMADEADFPVFPFRPAAYAVTAVAVWHALSVDNAAPDGVTWDYLQGRYRLNELIGGFEFREKLIEVAVYETAAGPLGEAEETLKNFLTGLTAKCTDETWGLRRDVTLAGLLERVKNLTRQSPGAVDNLIDRLPRLAGIPEDELPPGPEKGRPELREKLDKSFARGVRGLIEDGNVKQFIFTGAPGTGKTYAAALLARYLGTPQEWLPGSSPYTLVQFHPSYDYTDFVEGLRPVTGEDGNPRFVKLDGSFKAFCRRVAEANDPGGKYFFIIDEINRAELSKVFGELMYCMEEGKRGGRNAVQTQYQNLKTYDLKRGQELAEEEDCFAGGFFIPENVYIIGTMNDIDRSAESMDFALRRRFHMLEAVVDREMLLGAFSEMGFGENARRLTECVLRLNDTLVEKGADYGLNRQYHISHGQFANLPENVQRGPADGILEHVWKYRLENLLREYLRGVDEGRINEFTEACRKAFKGSDT